jgi:hypothetical protein
MYVGLYLQYIQQHISYVQYVSIATQQTHWDIDASRMDINMDIIICILALQISLSNAYNLKQIYN